MHWSVHSVPKLVQVKGDVVMKQCGPCIAKQ